MSKLCDYIDSVIDNRGKNPDKYYSIEKYPVIDNYLIKNTIYPIMSDVKRYIDQEEYDNFLRCYIRKDEVLMTLVGNGYGNVTLAPSDNVAIIQNTIGFRTKNNLNNIFLFYYLQYINKSIRALDRGSSQPSLKVSDILDLNVNIPEIKKQILISNTLQTIDLKIENNNKIISTLEHLAKTIYDYWFLQFDFPNEDGNPYKSSGGKMVWNDELKCKIPEGWNVTNVGNITTCLDSKRVPLSSKDRENMKGPYPYYGATSEMDSVNEYLFDGDYVLLAEDGSVMDENGFPILQRASGKVWVNNHAHVLQPKKLYGCKLLMFILKNIPIAMIKTGSIQMKVNQENLNTFKVLNIPENLIEKVNTILNPIDSKIIKLKQENQKLTSLRDFLLPMLMNGQVTFKEDL